MKFFCRRECKEDDILIKTPENEAQSSRYSIKYKNTAPAGGFLSVTITNLTKSDSGRYRFGVGRSVLPDSYGEFDIRVLDGEFLQKYMKPDIFGKIIIFIASYFSTLS